MKALNETDVSWDEGLDSDEDLLIARIAYSPDFKEVESFAVIYAAILGGKLTEIIRFDCGKKEKVHVHTFGSKPEKRNLNKEKSIETVEEIISLIRKNWRIYKIKFLEK